MLEKGHGNLLAADTDALVNTVNTVGVMGKGIALQFKRAFPANYRAYQAACARGEIRLGQMFVFDTGALGPRRYIINFPTKNHWRNASRLADIESGLQSLVTVVKELGIESIAIPALGCGNGGLAWDDVGPLIEAASAEMTGVRAIVFPPEGAPKPEAMPNATAAPALTTNRALLIDAISRYLARARLQEVREGVSELEIQKIAYLLQLLGAPLKLTFTRGHYGPYSADLSHDLNRLEGHYLSGLGDRSAHVTQLAPIVATEGATAAASSLLAAHPDNRERIDAMLNLVAGFETPYSLELLATTHFAAVQEPPTGDPAKLADRVAGWSLRKARLFTEAHVRIAAERLAENDLLPRG